MVKRLLVILMTGAGVSLPWSAQAADKADVGPMYQPDVKAESAFYRIVTLPIPDDIVLECGSLECAPDGSLFVGTRRGDIWRIENAYSDPPTDVKFTKWATGLHEVLGLAFNPKDACLYACTRQDITRLKDRNGDGTADVYEVYCDEWAISGDLHEYGFMSPFDQDGNLYVTLCLTGSSTSKAPWRGWVLKITPDGKMHPYASGVRSPGGIDFDIDGNLLYTDNQGPWNGTSSVKLVKKGSFQGNPAGWLWYDLPIAKKELGERPKEPLSPSRIHLEMEKVPQLVPPPLWLPQGRLGQSASGIAVDRSSGKFGPFAGQLFVGDQHHSNVVRCATETVNGRLQGAAFPFKYGFGSGIVPMKQAPDGSLWVGGTNRGWGSVGPREFALERLVWTGKSPFEIQTMRVKNDGFELTFTEPLDRRTAADAATWKFETYSYVYRSEYGSPEVDDATPAVQSVTLSEDGKIVRLKLSEMRIGSVHELRCDNLRTAKSETMVHPVAYYTLWALPGPASAQAR